MKMNRRSFILGSTTLTMLGMPFLGARAERIRKRNLVVIMLRGGMDGLSAVPSNDKILNSARPDIQVRNVRRLNTDFSLHPRLETFHELWREQKAAVVHATNIPYYKRSHFEGQDLMQSGGHTPYGEQTGWLGRGIEAAELTGLAVSLPMPLLLRGAPLPDNYFPTYWRLPSTRMMQQVATTFDEGSLLATTMSQILARPRSMLEFPDGDGEDAVILAETAAQQMKKESGPRVAVFDVEGFDTHAAQGGSDGEHGEKLGNVDELLRVLRDEMEDQFDNTLVLTLTEFGRTLNQNGGYGTEHGYGTAILMAGGLLKKAQIHADWPGLRTKGLFEGRDLNATIDARAVYCSAMAACFDVDFDYLRKQVFWGEALSDLTETLFKV